MQASGSTAKSSCKGDKREMGGESTKCSKRESYCWVFWSEFLSGEASGSKSQDNGSGWPQYLYSGPRYPVSRFRNGCQPPIEDGIRRRRSICLSVDTHLRTKVSRTDQQEQNTRRTTYYLHPSFSWGAKNWSLLLFIYQFCCVGLFLNLQ